MSAELIVITFKDTQQAGAVFEAMKRLRNAGGVELDDAAVIVKDEKGKVRVKNQLDTGVIWGALGGGTLGLLLASVFFPLAGIVIGAVGGALVGKTLDLGVDQKFVKDVTESLEPGSSALFLLGRGNPDAITASLRPYQGTIYQTTLPTEAVEALERALKNSE